MVAKKQHFVPQLLLRGFAAAKRGESRLNVYDFKRQQYRPKQNIKDLCAGNYEYDVDDSFEEFLSEHVETPFGSELKILSQVTDRFDPVPSRALLRFLVVQLARTREAYEGSLAFTNAGVQTMFAEFARLNGLEESAFRRLRVGPSEPRAVRAYLAAYAATQYRLLGDLRLALIVNTTNTEFILSDHPVFQHNWYLRESSHPMAASITVRGIQFFLPVSPSVACCLYDPGIYLYRDASAGVVIEASNEDVRLLNSFQAINAGALLMASSDFMGPMLSKLGTRYSETQAFVETATHVPASLRNDGTIRSTHFTQRRQLLLSAMPEFVKIKNKVRKRRIECVLRDPVTVRAHEWFNEDLRRGDDSP